MKPIIKTAIGNSIIIKGFITLNSRIGLNCRVLIWVIVVIILGIEVCRRTLNDGNAAIINKPIMKAQIVSIIARIKENDNMGS